MPKLHLCVSDEVVDKLRQRAEANHMSVGRYLAELVRREVGTGWPEGFFEEVVGGWQGESPNRSPQGNSERRDCL